MLSMLLPVEKVWILREPDYDAGHYVDIEQFKACLLDLMRWNRDEYRDRCHFSEKAAIHDFIVLCFLVGNDFLPTLPTVSILDGFLNSFLEIYKDVVHEHGHLVYQVPRTKELRVKVTALHAFFRKFSDMEQQNLERKYQSQDFHPDPLVLKHRDKNTGNIDMVSFKEEYYQANFPQGTSKTDIIDSYLYGMHWILNYYRNGIPDWHWFYPFLYGPFCSDMISHLDPYVKQPVKKYSAPRFEIHYPVPSFLQLMIVLPAANFYLLPQEFHWTILHPDSPFHQEYSTTNIAIDLAGKKKEWEGIVQLPPVHFSKYETQYQRIIQNISANHPHFRRNKIGRPFLYFVQDGKNKPVTEHGGGFSISSTIFVPLQNSPPWHP